MYKKRIIALTLSVILSAASFPITAAAAPKKMADGTMFDAEFYAATYPDVVAALGKSESALYNHYKNFGKKEGRKPTADSQGAAAQQPAAQASSSVQFDAAYYASAYPDVVAVFGSSQSALYNHYVKYGMKEGRKPNANAAGGTPVTQAAQTQTGAAPAAQTAAPSTTVAAPASYVKRWKGRNVSVLGDSISTFGGMIPQGYEAFYPRDFMPDNSQTWWMQSIRAGGMNLVANASWSGSQVSGDVNDETGKPGCSLKRVQGLFGKDKAPNVIFIMIGTNDFLVANAPQNFGSAYGTMLSNIKAAHPGAQLVCFTCLPVISTGSGTLQVNDLGLTINDYNAQIRAVAPGHGAIVCDTYACGITAENWRSYLSDGIHPNSSGMAVVASYIVKHL